MGTGLTAFDALVSGPAQTAALFGARARSRTLLWTLGDYRVELAAAIFW